ncbi:MAG: putative metalloprotease CJM1_0395 family protein [Opitutales bacterium]
MISPANLDTSSVVALPLRDQDLAARERERAQRDRGGHVIELPKQAPERLSDEEQKQLDVLQERDHKVRAEQIAEAVRSGLAAQVHFIYRTGPDGNRYAVDGQVEHDVAASFSPEKTIERARELRAAILSSPDPSPKDLQVVAEIDRLEKEALRELRKSEASAEEGASPPSEGSPTKSAERAEARAPASTATTEEPQHPGLARYREADARSSAERRRLEQEA